MKGIVLEAACVALAGAVLAFVANALSPRGLNLAHDNFPRRPVFPGLSPATNSVATGSNGAPAQPSLAERLRAENLQLAQSNEVFQLYNDPRRVQELIVFIDARDDNAYAAGHIPGAYQFNRYYPDKYVGTMLQVCNPAQQIVVYCNGGHCEDSEFAALMLAEWGVPKDKLSVFGGGITEWTNNRWPLETGARLSGNFHQY